MSHPWLVAMGIASPHVPRMGERTLLGHRLLCILRIGPKSMRALHAATGRLVPAGQLRAALAELCSAGLAMAEVAPSGRRGGRPKETWSLTVAGAAVVSTAQAAVDAAAAARPVRPPARSRWKPPSLGELRRSGLMPPEGGRTPGRARRRKPVPQDLADAVCAWIAAGNFLRHFCRRPGMPSSRTIYAWAAKDREFAREFRLARDFGERMIRESYVEVLESPDALAAFAGSRSGRREFHRRFVRPIDLHLQRWRKHPRRKVDGGTAGQATAACPSPR